MKKTIIFLLILSLVCTLAACGKDKNPSETQKDGTEGSDPAESTQLPQGDEEDDMRLNVTKHGIIPNSQDSAASNTRKMSSLLRKAKSGDVIFFPEGDYYFESRFGCLNLSGAENITLEGENATVINSSYDPTLKRNISSAGKSVTVNLTDCSNITFKNLSFDYARYTQVCGKVASVSAGRTIIELDERYLNGESKIPLTGDEYIMAVNVLDPDGNVISDHYASDEGFDALLAGHMYSIKGSFGSKGDTVIARFTLGTYASPTIFAASAKDLKFENVRSYSSPTATFYATLDNENFTFDGFNIAPPEGAEWLWGTNVDSVHIKGIRGKVTLKNSTFRGLGDDALNVHSVAPKVTGISGDTVSLEYIYGGDADSIWSREGDVIEFYDSSFKLLGSATVKKPKKGKLTLENISGEIKEGCFARNRSTSPELEIENVTVDGGRARAFLIQVPNATVKNCRISDLGLAAIIIAPDTRYWGEMGPSENVVISGVDIENVCTMKNAACLGAIFVSNSHDTAIESEMLHGTVKINGNTFTDVNAPALYAIYTEELEFTDNELSGNTASPVHSHCGNVNIEEN